MSAENNPTGVHEDNTTDMRNEMADFLTQLATDLRTNSMPQADEWSITEFYINWRMSHSTNQLPLERLFKYLTMGWHTYRTRSAAIQSTDQQSSEQVAEVLNAEPFDPPNSASEEVEDDGDEAMMRKFVTMGWFIYQHMLDE
jgi:hypothetical protein